MAIAHTPESPYAKEAVKWEATHTMYGPPGRPFVYREYPKRLYQVARAKTGGSIDIVHAEDVDDELMEANLRSRGFIALSEAAEWVEHQEHDLAELAANRAFNEQRMSPAAKAEAARADAETSAHLPAIPDTPIKRRGRPAKVVTHA